MKTFTFLDVAIRVDSNDRICIDDLRRAVAEAGYDPAPRWGDVHQAIGYLEFACSEFVGDFAGIWADRSRQPTLNLRDPTVVAEVGRQLQAMMAEYAAALGSTQQLGGSR